MKGRHNATSLAYGNSELIRCQTIESPDTAHNREDAKAKMGAFCA